MHLIAQKQLAPQAKLVMLGETLDGHDLDMLVLGEEAPEKKKIWVIARQHPGETMAEWFIEGLLDRLTDRCCHSLFHWFLNTVVFLCWDQTVCIRAVAF